MAVISGHLTDQLATSDHLVMKEAYWEHFHPLVSTFSMEVFK